ncbi:MAG: flagellar hook basal-body protein [Bacteroidota bacterium]
MADGIYVGMAAAAARAEQLESIADNLANGETPGFKASHPAFQSFLPKGAGPAADKVATAVVGTGADMAAGAVVTTGNPLDVIPHEDAFMMVQTSTGPAYTRNGRLTVSPDGLLISGGRLVIGLSGNPIQIPVGATALIHERAGSVMVGDVEVDRVALFQLQGNVAHVGPSLYGPGPGGAVTPFDGGVSVGQLEMGNSTPLSATVQMIGAQRQFETAMQAIQTYRRLDDRAIEVGKSR